MNQMKRPFVAPKPQPPVEVPDPIPRKNSNKSRTIDANMLKQHQELKKKLEAKLLANSQSELDVTPSQNGDANRRLTVGVMESNGQPTTTMDHSSSSTQLGMDRKKKKTKTKTLSDTDKTKLKKEMAKIGRAHV